MENQINFTETVIVQKIIDQNEDLQKLKFLSTNVDQSKQIDGFMGNIIFLTIEFESDNNEKIERKFVVKLMKPPSPHRTKIGSDFMFFNELFIYKIVIPTFIGKFGSKFKTIDKDLWCPRTFLTETGIFPQLGNLNETILVLENLAPNGYRLGHRINLSESELRLMCKAIAQYHACTYAMRINGDPDLDTLKNGITPLPFIKKDEKSMSEVAYSIAVERLFKYLDENPDEIDSEQFKDDLNVLRGKYYERPAELMERFLRDDEIYSVILHGDYNRNNVLFKYEKRGEEEVPIDLRFIDFQEVRYGTPAIDLSFFLFMNMEPKLMNSGLIMTLVKYYHECLMNSIAELLEVKISDPSLKNYEWVNFYAHFKQFGLYGAMVAVLFVPWMRCSEEELSEVVAEFERDMHSDKFRQLCITCGGKSVDERITTVMRHASKLGFMEMKEIKFAEEIVVPKLIASNVEFQNKKLIKASARSNSQIDGFMGTILFLDLEFETPDKKSELYKTVVKLMKPHSPMRDLVRADIQFINEIYIYRDVIPTFLEKFQDKFKTIDKQLWCAKIHLAEVDFFPQLSNEKETLLVLENLTPKNYRLGHRINLTSHELRLMAKAIAQYHACTYAMRVNQDPRLEKLISGVIPLGFERDDGKSLYDILYEIALERIFEYLDDAPEELDSEDFKRNVQSFRERYSKTPLKLMERFRRVDPTFSAILHGDYNRNNVLFRYETRDGRQIPVDLRMIDFQEVRYGSPAIDLAFFMFMNIHPTLLKTDLFMDTLKFYHSSLIEAMCELLECGPSDKKLDPYSWENFFTHFKQFAFYGVMVSIHFVPWMACPEEECEQMAKLFEQDMHSKEFKSLAMICGGKAVNQRMTENLRFASKMGFMEMIGKDD
uniref:CSON007435 protein n=1 Tax=Culicoides sonorensis TaxID=179676 RepID=A0A336LXP0_CULSO